MADNAERDKRIDQLLAKGMREEHLTKADILAAFPEYVDNEEQIEALTTVCNEMGIPVVDLDEEVSEDALLEPEEILTGEVVLDDTADRRDTEPTNDSVRMYLREIGRFSLIDGEEEVRLAKGIRTGSEATSRLEKEADSLSTEERQMLELKVLQGNLAQRRLSEANLRLVVSVAKRYLGRGMSFLDLIEEGNLGLLRAVEKFDHRKGYKFSTYATWWIRQSISRAIADQARTIRIPVHMVESLNRVQRTARQLQQMLGREPTPEEIAANMSYLSDMNHLNGEEMEEADLTSPDSRSKLKRVTDKVRQIMNVSQEPMSLETPVGSEENSVLVDFIQDESSVSPADQTTRELLREQMHDALQTLTPRERSVLALRFGLEDGEAHTLEEVGQQFGVTRERIRQIEAKALRKLRHPTRSRKLRDYLT